MNFIHCNEVNNISESNLLHDIINPSKRALNISIAITLLLYVDVLIQVWIERNLITFESYLIVDTFPRFYEKENSRT